MLTLDHLAFERNHELLFSDIEHTLRTGEVTQVRGANGCGKSTLLRMLAGYIEPQQGAILWQQQNITNIRDEYQQHLCYIGHQNGLKPYLTVYENLQLNTLLAGLMISREHVFDVLERMQLRRLAEQQVISLSAGQARRLALARLLLGEKRLWILDEPITALDAAGQVLLEDLLQQHTATGGMAIIATHQDLAGVKHTITLGNIS